MPCIPSFPKRNSCCLRFAKYVDDPRMTDDTILPCFSSSLKESREVQNHYTSRCFKHDTWQDAALFFNFTNRLDASSIADDKHLLCIPSFPRIKNVVLEFNKHADASSITVEKRLALHLFLLCEKNGLLTCTKLPCIHSSLKGKRAF